MKAIMITVRLWWFYLTYKDIKKAEIRKRFAKDFKGKIFECVSKTNWKKDLMKIPAEEREFFKQFVGKVGLCFDCDKVENLHIKHGTGWETETIKGTQEIEKVTCVDRYNLYRYCKGKACAINITNLKPFEKPKELNEFNLWQDCGKCWHEEDCDCEKEHCFFCKTLTRAPQGYYYIEVEE